MSYLERSPSNISLVGTCAQGGLNDTAQAQYMALYFDATSTTSTNVATIMPVTAVFNRLYVNVTSNASTTNCTVTLNVNNVDTILTVTITALTTGTFADLTDAVTVNPGDLVCFNLNQASTGITTGIISCRLLM